MHSWKEKIGNVHLLKFFTRKGADYSVVQARWWEELSWFPVLSSQQPPVLPLSCEHHGRPCHVISLSTQCHHHLVQEWQYGFVFSKKFWGHPLKNIVCCQLPTLWSLWGHKNGSLPHVRSHSQHVFLLVLSQRQPGLCACNRVRLGTRHIILIPFRMWI